jgi:hypothetical protein
MATGPEHYKEAERLLEEALKAEAQLRNGGGVAALPSGLREAAQVHATLALAAATGLADYVPDSGKLMTDKTEWFAAASRASLNREAERAELAELAAEDKDGVL